MIEFTKILTKSDIIYRLISISANYREEFPKSEEIFTFICEEKSYQTFIDDHNRIRGIDLPNWYSDHTNLVPNSILKIIANKNSQEYYIKIITIPSSPSLIDSKNDIERKQAVITLSKRKERKSGSDLTNIFLEALVKQQIKVRKINNLHEIDPNVKHTVKKCFLLNDIPTFIIHNNSSRSKNVRFLRGYWGLTKESLNKLALLPYSVVIFLVGRNLALGDRVKIKQSEIQLSSELIAWLESNLIERVFIFPAIFLWEKLRELNPPRGNYKFNFFFTNFSFTGSQIEYLNLTKTELEKIALDRYELLQLTKNTINNLKEKFKPYFESNETPWRLMKQIMRMGILDRIEKDITKKIQIKGEPQTKIDYRIEEDLSGLIDKTKKEIIHQNLIEKIKERLRVNGTNSSQPSEFVKDVADSFEYLGFNVSIIDISGDTDVLVTAPLGSHSYKIVVEVKTSERGKVIEAQINWPSIRDHKQKHHAEFMCVVGPEFAKGSLLDRAIEYKSTLIRTEDLIRILELYNRYSFSLSSFKSVLKEYSFLSEEAFQKLEEDSEKRIYTSQLMINIIKKLSNITKNEPNPTINTLFYKLSGQYSLDEIESIIRFLDLLPLNIIDYNHNTKTVELLTGNKGILDILTQLMKDITI